MAGSKIRGSYLNPETIMKRIFISAVFAIAFAPFAQAEDFYLGANIASGTDGHVNVTEGGTTTRHDASGKQRPLGLYAGYVLSPGWALEAGYSGSGGSTDFDLDAGRRLRLRTSMGYLAVRADWKLGEAWSLYGKAGVAQGRLKLDASGPGAGPDERVHKTGAYLGVGAAWFVTKDVALQLELEHTTKLKYEELTAKMDKISLGVRFGF